METTAPTCPVRPAGEQRRRQPPSARVQPQRPRPGQNPDSVPRPHRLVVHDTLRVVPHPVRVDHRPRPAPATPSISPSQWNPALRRASSRGDCRTRAGQFGAVHQLGDRPHHLTGRDDDRSGRETRSHRSSPGSDRLHPVRPRDGANMPPGCSGHPATGGGQAGDVPDDGSAGSPGRHGRASSHPPDKGGEHSRARFPRPGGTGAPNCPGRRPGNRPARSTARSGTAKRPARPARPASRRGPAT